MIVPEKGFIFIFIRVSPNQILSKLVERQFLVCRIERCYSLFDVSIARWFSKTFHHCYTMIKKIISSQLNEYLKFEFEY